MVRNDLGVALAEECGGCAKALLKHLAAAGIRSWEGLDVPALHRFRQEVERTTSPNSARTYCKELTAFIGRRAATLGLPDGWRKELRSAGGDVVRTWLTPEELALLEGAEAGTEAERSVKAAFLVSAYTGMRHSDVAELTPSNVRGGQLDYVSAKTHTHAVVPCSPKVERWIVESRSAAVSLAAFNAAIRRLCERAGIDGEVKVFRGGRASEGPKWRFVSSHTGRVSFCTNLARMGVPLIDIARMAGHSSVKMTERYVVAGPPSLNAAAMAYFG